MLWNHYLIRVGILHKNVGKDNVKIIQGAITDKKKINGHLG